MNEANGTSGVNGVDGLGVNVWWTVPKVVVDSGKAQDALVRNGFSKGLMRLPSRRLEVSRAARSLQNRRSKNDRRVTEKTKDNAQSAVFGILDCQRVDDEQVQFEQGTTVRFDKGTGVVTAEGTLAECFNLKLEEYTGKVTEDEVRDFLRYAIRASYGVAKRPSGGIYFVPPKGADVIQRAQAVLKDMGTGARIYIEGVMGGQREKANVWESVEMEIGSRIEEALLATSRIGRSVKAVKDHKAELESLEELMGVYQSLLGEEAKYEAVAERIEDAVKEVENKMSEMQAARLAPPAPAISVAELSSPAPVSPVAVPAAVPVAVPPVVPAAAKDGGSKIVEAAVTVLSFAQCPLDGKKLVELATANGYYKSDCGNPVASFLSVLCKAMDAGENRVVRVRRGWYALAA